MTTEPIEARVLPAVIRLLEQGELKGGVMVKLAKEAGMSLSTLYAIVPSKADLMRIVADYYQRTARARVTGRLTGEESEQEIVLADALENLQLFTADPVMGLQVIAAAPANGTSSPGRTPSPAPAITQDRAAVDGAAKVSWPAQISPIIVYGLRGIMLQRCQGLITQDEAVQGVHLLVNTVYEHASGSKIEKPAPLG